MIKTENLSFIYKDTGIHALTDFSIHVDNGEIHCLLGASGSGKTTALRLIAGFMKPQKGCISIGGHTVCSEDIFIPVEHRKVGIVFQHHGLLPHMTCRKNIEFACNTKDSKYIDTLLEITKLSDFQNNRPDQLSGGQQQRTALARALAGKPDLLLMDEPFSSLDEQLKETLLPEIRGIVKKLNIPTIFVTHSKEECSLIGDSISYLKNGKLEEHLKAGERSA